MPRRSARVVLAVAIPVCLAACGGAAPVSPPPPPPPPPAITAIAIDADSPNLAPGATLALRATVKDATGATRSDPVAWSSLDQGVATVSSAGVVTGVGGGVARVRAAIGSVTAEATVSVARAFAPGGPPLEIVADPTGHLHLYTPSFGGVHYQLRATTGQGAGVAGAIVGYAEQDGKSVFAIDGPDPSWAPSLLFGPPDSLALRVPGAAPFAPAGAAEVRVAKVAIAARLERLSDVALPQRPNAYQLESMFAQLRADPGSCVSWLTAVPQLRARGDREIAVAFRPAGAPTGSILAATVVRREAMAGTDAAVADLLLGIGADRWGVGSTQAPTDRVRLRTDFVDAAKVGAQLRRFWDIAVVIPGDPTCPATVAQLGFGVQPGSAAPNVALSPAVTVVLRDAQGATITGATDPVTITLGQNAGAAVLSGTLTRTPVNGVATFADLAVDRAGTYTLVATAAGKSATSASFTVVAPPPPAPSSIGVGHIHGCGIVGNGTTWCWGGGSPGLNGDGGVGNSAFVPSQVVGGHSFRMTAGGGGHNCALTTAGQVYCWGNALGMLGNGTNAASSTPMAVTGGHVYQWLGAGSLHTCAIRIDGAAFCWGSNSNGQLGDGGAATPVRLSPVPVTGGLQFASVFPGFNHTCALTPAGAAYCWGANGSGQLGDGTTTPRPAPTAVAGGLSFTRLSSIAFTTCGLTQAGSMYCWGANTYGQIGDGTTTGRLVPTQVGGGFVFVAMSVGQDHACGVVANGTLYCWGRNNTGQLGLGTTGSNQLAPVATGGALRFRTVAASGNFSCAIATDTKAYCWGVNNFGQLGNATNVSSLSPVPIFGNLVF